MQSLAGSKLTSQLGVSRVEPEHRLKLSVTDRHDNDGKQHRTACSTRDHGVRSHAMNNAGLKIRPRRSGNAGASAATRPRPDGVRRQDDLRCSSATGRNRHTAHQPTEQHDDGQGNRPYGVGGGRGGEELYPHGGQRPYPRHRSRQILQQALGREGPSWTYLESADWVIRRLRAFLLAPYRRGSGCPPPA